MSRRERGIVTPSPVTIRRPAGLIIGDNDMRRTLFTLVLSLFASEAGKAGRWCFLMRLSPVLPFNLLNYGCGLTTVGLGEHRGDHLP